MKTRLGEPQVLKLKMIQKNYSLLSTTFEIRWSAIVGPAEDLLVGWWLAFGGSVEELSVGFGGRWSVVGGWWVGSNMVSGSVVVGQ